MKYLEDRNRISSRKFGRITSPYKFNFKIEEIMLTTLPCQLPNTLEVDCDTAPNVGIVSPLDTQWGAASSILVYKSLHWTTTNQQVQIKLMIWGNTSQRTNQRRPRYQGKQQSNRNQRNIPITHWQMCTQD